MDIVELIQNTDWHYAILVFFARLTDVSLGTLRTIAIVHGRTMLAFWLGFFESAIWLAVVSTIVQAVYQQPLLGVVYAFGFASGNLVGITIEKWIAMGHLILRVISSNTLPNALSNADFRCPSSCPIQMPQAAPTPPIDVIQPIKVVMLAVS